MNTRLLLLISALGIGFVPCHADLRDLLTVAAGGHAIATPNALLKLARDNSRIAGLEDKPTLGRTDAYSLYGDTMHGITSAGTLAMGMGNYAPDWQNSIVRSLGAGALLAQGLHVASFLLQGPKYIDRRFYQEGLRIMTPGQRAEFARLKKQLGIIMAMKAVAQGVGHLGMSARFLSANNKLGDRRKNADGTPKKRGFLEFPSAIAGFGGLYAHKALSIAFNYKYANWVKKMMAQGRASLLER